MKLGFDNKCLLIFVDGLHWARLEGIGLGPKMLAAIKSLYASGTLSMKVGGAAGPSLVQQNGVRQGCPLSPTLFSIFFDGLHGHLDCSLPHAGLQLGSPSRHTTKKELL